MKLRYKIIIGLLIFSLINRALTEAINIYDILGTLMFIAITLHFGTRHLRSKT